MNTIPQLYSFDHALDMSDDKIGHLRDSSDVVNDPLQLNKRLEEDGYLYLKGFLNRDQVLEARESILKLIDGPGFVPEVAAKCKEIQTLLYSGKLIEFYTRLFGEEIRHYDYTWMRVMGPGKGTNPHCDLPYMGRGTHKHMTCWVPYGDVTYTLGGLMVLEGSHKRMDLLDKYVYRDVDEYCENKPSDIEKVKDGKWTFTGTLSHNPPVIRNKFGGKWLVTEYKAGDFLTFGMFTVHAALDNRTQNEVRISTDSRYQKASHPIDERWIGANPPAHGDRGKKGLIC